jgi:hypothetical protein
VIIGKQKGQKEAKRAKDFLSFLQLLAFFVSQTAVNEHSATDHYQAGD